MPEAPSSVTRDPSYGEPVFSRSGSSSSAVYGTMAHEVESTVLYILLGVQE